MKNNYPDDAKTTVEERYTNATHASNLRVQAERTGSADVLIAMGWSPSRLGAALMRLHSEWDGCEKPRKPTRTAVDLIAASLPRIEDGQRKQDGVMVPNMVLDMDTAHKTAHDWYMHELKILFGKLKTMPDVRHQLVQWAAQRLIHEPEFRVAEVLAWWLDHVCPVCEGRKKDRIPGTPSLSHKDCKACHGTGEARIPQRQGNDYYVMETKKLLKHIDVCVKTAQTSVRQRLQAYRPTPRGAK
jgi:hypothetical protein